MAGRRLQTAGYIAVLAVCFALGMLAGWNQLAVRVDNQAYDLLTEPPAGARSEEAIVIAIDEANIVDAIENYI